MNCPTISPKNAACVFILLAFAASVFPALAQENAPDIDAIIAAAKRQEEDGRINFCGFFIGMSCYDAQALAEHYQLEQGSFNFGDSPSVVSATFTLQAVRKIVKRGNTFEELKQAVERQVGDMEFDPNIPSHSELHLAQSLLGEAGVEALVESRTSNKWYKRKTIDGDIVRIGEKSGLIIKNDEVAKIQDPVWESDWARAKSNAAAVAAADKARADKAMEEKLWADKEAVAVTTMIENMLPIPGRDSQMDKSIVMAKYEVTQALWKAVMGENPSEIKGVDYPVENVSWNDCQEFLEKLNAMDEVKKSGLIFRLPTADEWEYACRAGTTGDYCKLADGTDITEYSLDKIAWFHNNSHFKTHPVGEKLPNAFGLYDMHGNVREWTSTNDDRKRMIHCGGDYFNSASSCKVKLRLGDLPDDHTKTHGFRLAADDPKANEEELRMVRKLGADSNARVAAVKPVLDKMGVETMVVELPGGVQLLMNKLPNGKWFGAFEVTQAQWLSVTGKMPSSFDGPDRPMRSLSNYDCRKFLEKLNALDAAKKLGLSFQLPTKEEWEYACRAGAKGDYCLGPEGKKISKSTLGDVAWYNKNSGSKIHPVGEKNPNAFGLYDIHGNVSEWTSTVVPFLDEPIYCGGDCNSDANSCKAGSGKAASWKTNGWNTGCGFRLAAQQMADE